MKKLVCATLFVMTTQCTAMEHNSNSLELKIKQKWIQTLLTPERFGNIAHGSSLLLAYNCVPKMNYTNVVSLDWEYTSHLERKAVIKYQCNGEKEIYSFDRMPLLQPAYTGISNDKKLIVYATQAPDKKSMQFVIFKTDDVLQKKLTDAKNGLYTPSIEHSGIVDFDPNCFDMITISNDGKHILCADAHTLVRFSKNDTGHYLPEPVKTFEQKYEEAKTIESFGFNDANPNQIAVLLQDRFENNPSIHILERTEKGWNEIK